MEHFYAYRVFLNQDKTLLTFKNKEETFLDVINKIKSSNVYFHDYGEHILIFQKQKGENIYIFQLAKKQNFDKPTLEGGKIEDIVDVQYPYIYLIIHYKKQLILVQKNTKVFQDINAVKVKLSKFFTEQMIQNGVHCNLSEITDHREFWEQVESMDVIQKVELEYTPPNFFGGKKAADRLVKDVHDDTNFEKFKIFLQNKLEGLKFSKETFKEHIQRISQGAGNYVIQGLKDGVDIVIKKVSKLHVKQDVPNIEEETVESLEERFNQVEDINNENR